MEANKLFLFFNLIFLTFVMIGRVENASGHGHHDHHRRHHHHQQQRKLFVFGDSYVDNGNLGRIGQLTHSWYIPYGNSWPRRPTGRFSDGAVLSDFIASYMGLRPPLPYKDRRLLRQERFAPLIGRGMNFAVAGSGVFDTGNMQRRLEQQIDTFESEIEDGVFSRLQSDLPSSVALVAISGNDYAYYLGKGGGTIDGALVFIGKLIGKLKEDLTRIQSLGVGKVVVTKLHPVGCTPQISRSDNHTKCNDIDNMAVGIHNTELDSAINQLNTNTSSTTFHSLDLFTAFMSIINQDGEGEGEASDEYFFDAPLVPCCEGSTNTTNCGEVDGEGLKLYTLCDDPRRSFYWDSLHPTQAGWSAVFNLIKPQLHQIIL